MLFENAINQNFEVESLLQARGNKVTAGNSTRIVHSRLTQHSTKLASEEATNKKESSVQRYYPNNITQPEALLSHSAPECHRSTRTSLTPLLHAGDKLCWQVFLQEIFHYIKTSVDMFSELIGGPKESDERDRLVG